MTESSGGKEGVCVYLMSYFKPAVKKYGDFSGFFSKKKKNASPKAENTGMLRNMVKVLTILHSVKTSDFCSATSKYLEHCS